MSTMEGGLQQLLAFPPYPMPATPLPDSEYDKQIKAHIQYLNTIPASKLTNGVPNGGGDLLDVSVAWSSAEASTKLIDLASALDRGSFRKHNIVPLHSTSIHQRFFQQAKIGRSFRLICPGLSVMA